MTRQSGRVSSPHELRIRVPHVRRSPGRRRVDTMFYAVPTGNSPIMLNSTDEGLHLRHKRKGEHEDGSDGSENVNGYIDPDPTDRARLALFRDMLRAIRVPEFLAVVVDDFSKDYSMRHMLRSSLGLSNHQSPTYDSCTDTYCHCGDSNHATSPDLLHELLQLRDRREGARRRRVGKVTTREQVAAIIAHHTAVKHAHTVKKLNADLEQTKWKSAQTPIPKAQMIGKDGVKPECVHKCKCKCLDGSKGTEPEKSSVKPQLPTQPLAERLSQCSLHCYCVSCDCAQCKCKSSSRQDVRELLEAKPDSSDVFESRALNRPNRKSTSYHADADADSSFAPHNDLPFDVIFDSFTLSPFSNAAMGIRDGSATHRSALRGESRPQSYHQVGDLRASVLDSIPRRRSNRLRRHDSSGPYRLRNRAGDVHQASQSCRSEHPSAAPESVMGRKNQGQKKKVRWAFDLD